MNSNWEKDYALVSQLSEADLDENSSLKKMLHLIGENKKVIDFGCATGYFAQLLINKGCQVTGVEINRKAAKIAEQYCEKVIVADLDFVSLNEILQEKSFDVAVFGDVLEHLRNPWKILQETRNLLTSEGYVVASIPNIAHGAIRLALLQGRFDYMELGILDNTHLRFFTRKTIKELFENSGYSIDVIELTKLPVFSDSNLVPSIDKECFNLALIEQIEKDEDTDTLQFIIKSSQIYIGDQYLKFQEQYSKLTEQVLTSQNQLNQVNIKIEEIEIKVQDKETQIGCLQSQLQDAQVAVDKTQSQFQEIQVEMEQSHVKLQQNQVELEHLQSQLQQTHMEVEQSRILLHQHQTELEKSQLQLQQTQAKLEELQETVTAMKTSKFWKLRTIWFNVKTLLGISVN